MEAKPAQVGALPSVNVFCFLFSEEYTFLHFSILFKSIFTLHRGGRSDIIIYNLRLFNRGWGGYSETLRPLGAPHVQRHVTRISMPMSGEYIWVGGFRLDRRLPNSRASHETPHFVYCAVKYDTHRAEEFRILPKLPSTRQLCYGGITSKSELSFPCL